MDCLFRVKTITLETANVTNCHVIVTEILFLSSNHRSVQFLYLAASKTRERKEEYKERNSIVPWLKSDGDEIANQTHILRLRFEQVVCFFDIQPVSFTI